MQKRIIWVKHRAKARRYKKRVWRQRHKVHRKNYGMGLKFVTGIDTPLKGDLIRKLSKESKSKVIHYPEFRLHPSQQLKMADELIQLDKETHKDIIINTHSSNIIDRITRRVVEEKLPVDNVELYHVDQKGVHKVGLDPQKGITEWPEGFFDQSANEKGKILETLFKKYRK